MNIEINRKSEYVKFGELNGGDSFLFGGYNIVYVKFYELLYTCNDGTYKKRNAIDLKSGICVFMQDGDLVIPLNEKFTYNQQG